MTLPCAAMLLLCSWCVVPAASATELGLITGGENGTYYQFGLDLKRLVKPAGINLSVYPSKGSVENLYAISQRPGVQMAIVQSDVVTFVAGVQAKPAVAQIASKTRLVFPLYDEEVHVLGRQEIREFEDLAGRRVAVGQEGSGSYLTARLLFKLAGIAPAAIAPIDAREALSDLKAGRIDALFYVAGSPVRFLQDAVTAGDGLRLIPILNKSVLEHYPRAEILANVYGWQTTPVNTVAVKALLVSFDRRRDCDGVGRFARHIATRMDWLTKNGHPKWKMVDLEFPLNGWEQYDCVRKYLGK